LDEEKVSENFSLLPPQNEFPKPRRQQLLPPPLATRFRKLSKKHPNCKSLGGSREVQEHHGNWPQRVGNLQARWVRRFSSQNFAASKQKLIQISFNDRRANNAPSTKKISS